MKDAVAEIKNAFVQYLANELTLEDFQERIALAHWSVERVAPAMSTLVYGAVGKLSELSLGHRTERTLREELAIAISPFVSTQSEAVQVERKSVDRAVLFFNDGFPIEFAARRTTPHPVGRQLDWNLRLGVSPSKAA